jgi:hypothetical protein
MSAKRGLRSPAMLIFALLWTVLVSCDHDPPPTRSLSSNQPSLQPQSINDPKGVLDAAVNDLAEIRNYSWTATVHAHAMDAGHTGVMPMVIWPIDAMLTGKTTADGISEISLDGGKSPAILHAGNVAIKTFWGWKTGSKFIQDYDKNLENRSSHLRLAVIARDFQTPAEQLQNICGSLINIRRADDHIEARLGSGAALPLALFVYEIKGMPLYDLKPEEGDGSVSFWIENGELVKCVFTFGGVVDDTSLRGTVSYEFTDVGKTLIDIPGGAKIILGLNAK